MRDVPGKVTLRRDEPYGITRLRIENYTRREGGGVQEIINASASRRARKEHGALMEMTDNTLSQLSRYGICARARK